MTNQPFEDGLNRWQLRYSQADVSDKPIQGDVTREVQIAVQAYREAYGDESATALDVGAGEGRNTIFLAESGFDVTAVDGASAGIELIRQRLDARSLSANLAIADLREYESPQNVDLLIASYIVHLIPDPYEQIKKWQDSVRAGGICMVATRGRMHFDADELWFPEDFELKQLFFDAGWHIIHAREEDNWSASMERHFRQRAVVAMKPNQ